MSTLRLQERFTLAAPPERVWAYLIDPVRTVQCLPGAEITGQEDERTYSGAVKVKLGAVTVAYQGRVVLEEVDAATRSLRMVGRGREKTGSGAAEMTMEGRVLATPDGGSEVTVDSEVRLTGRIVGLGRGMVETVSAEIFKEFRTRLAAALERELDAGREGGATGTDPGEAPDEAAAGAADDSLRLVPLLWRALLSWLRRLVGWG